MMKSVASSRDGPGPAGGRSGRSPNSATVRTTQLISCGVSAQWPLGIHVGFSSLILATVLFPSEKNKQAKKTPEGFNPATSLQCDHLREDLFETTNSN